jgi:hypothetical protein
MKRSVLLTVVLAALLVNLALTAANRVTTDEARAQDGTIEVVLEPNGGGKDLRSAKEKVDQMLNLLQNMDRHTRELTLLSTNSAPEVAAATKHELETLQQILIQLQRRR